MKFTLKDYQEQDKVAAIGVDDLTRHAKCQLTERI